MRPIWRSVAVLEALRVLSNRLGRADGFAALVLVGQTPLALRLRRHALAALEARLAAHVHLRRSTATRPTNCSGSAIPRVWERRQLDQLHRLSGGSPRRLLWLHDQTAAPAPDVAAPRPVSIPSPVAGPEEETAPIPEDDALHIVAGEPWGGLSSSKPPLRVEENLIEVGWEPEPLADEAVVHHDGAVPVEDHYAALQAWNEWSSNQGRSAGAEPTDLSTLETAPAITVEEPEEAPAKRTPVPTQQASVWLEPRHTFAPYSQLFSQVRQANDSEP